MEIEAYDSLVEKIRTSFVERSFRAKAEIIELHHETGGWIIEQSEKYGKVDMEKLAGDSGVSKETLYKAKSFYEKFPDLEAFLAGHDKRLSWSHITQHLLPENKRPVEKITCPVCGTKVIKSKINIKAQEGS